MSLVKRLQIARCIAEAYGFGLKLAEVNAEKPWGGYLRFTQDSLAKFLLAYFNVNIQMADNASLEPKVLLIEPHKMFSLQYHKKRKELWRVLDGPVYIALGSNWSNLAVEEYPSGKLIEIKKYQWHRIIGMKNWGRIAEIWQHINPDDPSTEEDIQRVQDKFGRVDISADPTTIEERDKKWEAIFK